MEDNTHPRSYLLYEPVLTAETECHMKALSYIWMLISTYSDEFNFIFNISNYNNRYRYMLGGRNSQLLALSHGDNYQSLKFPGQKILCRSHTHYVLTACSQCTM